MEKRYNLPVAIALVVGTVIGSGIFFKAEAVLTKTGGNLSVGILAFIIMGVVMIISACTFGIVAQSHEGVEGLVGFAKASCGKTYSYYVGWFMSVIYYPSLVAVLSWLPARYFGVLMGWEDAVVGGRTMMLAGVFMVVTYAMNALAPKLAGKFAVSTTIIKLIPLLLMAIVGTIVGLTNGMTSFNFSNVVTEMPFTEGLFGAIVSLAFAFEGWICATSIGAELKDSKKNLPRALLIGTIIVAIVYVIYYIGLAGAVESAVMTDFAAACTPEQLAQLKTRNDALRRLAAQPHPDPRMFYELDSRLHESWFLATGKDQLWQLIQTSQNSYSRFRMLDLVAVGNFGDIVAEHDVLLDAIARNDTAAIRAQCSRHLYGGVTRLGEELSTKYADYFVSGTHWPDHAKEMQP